MATNGKVSKAKIAEDIRESLKRLGHGGLTELCKAHPELEVSFLSKAKNGTLHSTETARLAVLKRAVREAEQTQQEVVPRSSAGQDQTVGESPDMVLVCPDGSRIALHLSGIRNARVSLGQTTEGKYYPVIEMIEEAQ